MMRGVQLLCLLTCVGVLSTEADQYIGHLGAVGMLCHQDYVVRTRQLKKQLKRYETKATYFCLGSCIVGKTAVTN